MSSVESAPGQNVKELIMHLANDLKKRRVEYAITGFINSQSQPIGMIEDKGKTTWVEFKLKDVIETALMLKATGIFILHNHPVSIKESPNLMPSEADIGLLKSFLVELVDSGLQYYGFWITSNGHIVEVLKEIQTSKNNEIGKIISDIDTNKFLTVDLRNVITELTKLSVLQSYWYEILNCNIARHKFTFHVLKFRYWGSEDEVYTFKITATDENDTEYIGSLTVEEATKAYDAIKELLKIARHLEEKEIEYTEVKVTLCDQINCGFFQQGNEQSGFLYIGTHPIFTKVLSLQTIVDFLEKGFEKIEYVQNINDET